MGKIQENDARLQQLVSMARIGWWEVDFDEGVYYCSEFVADLLGIEGEGGNLAASKIRNLECPNYEICLIDYGCGKFNRKIHIMEQYP